MGTVTAKMFRTAFMDEWEQRSNQNLPALLASYPHDRAWTELMLRTGGVLPGVLERINQQLDAHSRLELRNEYYTVDAMFVGGKDLFREKLSYPSRVEAIVEHENGDNWEEEMWKLLFWRAPLKVLIGYDYNEMDFDKPLGHSASSETKGKWLGNKIKTVHSMYQEVVSHLAEPETEYLLLVGNRAKLTTDSPVQWRWCRIDKPDSAPQWLCVLSAS